MNPQEYERMRALEDWYWWFVARREAALRFLDDYAPKRNTLRVLDAGCGTGALLDDLARRPHTEAVGVDVSPEALALTRARGAAKRLVGGDLTRLPLAENRFDAVTALDVLEHVQDDRAAAAEIARALRPGGVLVVSVPAYRFLWSAHDVALHHQRRYVAGELRRVLEDAGLEIVRLTYLLTLLLPIAVAVRWSQRLLRRGEAKANLVEVCPTINRCLIALQRAELGWATRVSLPFGVSILAVARKPGAQR